MIKAYLVLLCGLIVLAGRDCLSADGPTPNAEQIKSLVLYAPKPRYPAGLGGNTRPVRAYLF
jgi:hypothetical protein